MARMEKGLLDHAIEQTLLTLLCTCQEELIDDKDYEYRPDNMQSKLSG